MLAAGAGGVFAFQRQGGVAVAVVATVVVGGVGDVAFGGKIVAFAVSCNGFLEGTHGRVAGVVAGDVQGGQGGVLFHGVGQGAATEFAWTKGKGTERVEGWKGGRVEGLKGGRGWISGPHQSTHNGKR